MLFLFGSYDGSGNYGDVLQLAAALGAVSELPGSPLAIAVVERQTHAQHRKLTQRYPALFGNAAFAFFQDDGGDPGEGLVRLVNPSTALIYIYGGGYLNRWWGARKVSHVAAAEALAGGRRVPLVASGLQVEEEAIAPGTRENDLLARARWIGVRDVDSLEYVRRQIPGAAARVVLAGDDALPFLERPQTEASPVVNLHINNGSWITGEPESMLGGIAALVGNLGAAASGPLELQPVIAYEDPHVSERHIVSRLLESARGDLASVGFEPTEPLDILDDTLANGLGAFRRARLTVSCSYHVALTSLLAGIPAVLLAQNDYYAQKAAGLRNLFGLDSSRIGVPGAPRDTPAAVEALVDGPARSELVSHLRTRSQRVAAQFARGRTELSTALVEGLRVSTLE